MAKLVDPDQLNQATEIVIDTTGKTVQLLVAGNLDDAAPGALSGVTKQAVYSFLKEEWKSDNALNKFKFPLKAFTKNEFLWINGWAPADAQTRQLFRDAGWQESVGTEDGDLYAGFISLGNFDAVADQGYYQQVTGFDQTTTNFDKTGNINEAVLVFDASGSDFTDFFKAFLREQGKTHASYNLLTEQGIPVLEATLYRFPLENGADLNIAETDVNIDANTPYTGMSVDYRTGDHTGVTTWTISTVYAAGAVVQSAGGRYFRTAAGGTSAGNDSDLAGGSDTGITWIVDPGERLIGSTYYHFSRIITGNSGTRFEIYEWGQRQLRKTSDINSNAGADGFGTVNGNVADEFFTFRGSDLILEEGVWIDGFDVNSQNNIVMQPHPVDGGSVSEVSFPFVAAGTFVFSQNIIDATDADTRVVVYFTNDDAGDDAGNDFDTSGAIIVDDDSGTDLDFLVTAGSIPWDYDYTSNIQRGAASANSDAPITIQLAGLADFEDQFFEFTIQQSTGQTFAINANDERNYANPV